MTEIELQEPESNMIDQDSEAKVTKSEQVDQNEPSKSKNKRKRTLLPPPPYINGENVKDA